MKFLIQLYASACIALFAALEGNPAMPHSGVEPVSCAAPDRPMPKADAPVPRIAGPSNYGDIIQTERKIQIINHPQ